MDDVRKRDRPATTQRVLAAAARILTDQGVAALGVNALAKAAECDKQLIYRYFGGLDGVMQALGADVAGRLSGTMRAELDAPPDTWAVFAAALARGLLAAYRSDPALVRLRAAELAAPSGTMASLAAARGAAMADWVARVRPAVPPPPGRDVPVLLALFTGAIEGAVMSAAATGGMVGVPLVSDADWARLHRTLLALVAAAFAPDGAVGQADDAAPPQPRTVPPASP